MAGAQDFKSLQDGIQSALVASTKCVNRIANEDISFQRTADPTVADKLDEASSRFLGLSTRLLQVAAKSKGLKVPALEDADDVENHWGKVVDVIDTLLENADTCLDEYTGLVKRKEAPTTETGSEPKRARPIGGKLDYSLRRADIPKPQLGFARKPDNFDASPWMPLLTEKPHAKTPLKDSLAQFINEERQPQHKHPYEKEILEMTYPQRVYEVQEPVQYQPIDTTKATWVDTFEGVLEMLAELKEAKEIAVDLEHHEFRTYNGLLSLMQISTRERDWVVDTLQPWRHKLEVLNEVFADPRIVKVFHGAFMDIVWLQRDLGLYIVGLFDTYHACVALEYAGRGLAFLLKRFVDFDADKKYQTADWRIRPLPEEMFFYARSDTHFLLYVYDMVRNELVERSDRTRPDKDLIEYTLEKSKETSLYRYENPRYDHETGEGSRGWYNFLAKHPSPLSSGQFAVYKAVHKWRDELARHEDESPAYVMSQHILSDIARLLPSDFKALWSILNNITPTLRGAVEELFEVIQEARAQGANGPSLFDFFRSTKDTSTTFALAGADTNKDEHLPDVSELRISESQLWGSIPMSTRWEATVPPVNNVQLTLPWEGFVISEAGPQQKEEPQTVPEAQSFEAATTKDTSNQEFTLKGGRKRKADEVNETVHASSESNSEEQGQSEDADEHNGISAQPLAEVEGAEFSSMGANDDDADATLRKKAKLKKKADRKAKNKQEKEERRAKKRAVKAAARGTLDDKDDEDDEEPFDYNTAQSVLNAQRGKTNATEKKTKVFDPYKAKTEDGPKGARRMHSERPGRSATFKK